MAVMYSLLVIISLFQWSGAFTPVVYPGRSLPSSQCGQSDPELNQQLRDAIESVKQRLAPPGCNPPSTCRAIHRCNSSASSGYYQIQAANGSAVQVYCDMERTNCGGEGGWMRVAHLNVTDSSSQCPDGYRVETVNSVTFCIRDTSVGMCAPILSESYGLNYSQVCGYVRGYQYGTMDCFNINPSSLGGFYVDGVSITYDTPPSHLWTYAAGLQEANLMMPGDPVDIVCPCNTPQTERTRGTPSFVGNDYYCESGLTNNPQSIWYTNDPLWDGMQCGGDEGPCCNHTGLPWFHKTLSTSTTATITTRVCLNEDTNNENIGIDRLALYVK